ncbi:MAG: TolC family protein [Pirellulales bacterium]
MPTTRMSRSAVSGRWRFRIALAAALFASPVAAQDVRIELSSASRRAALPAVESELRDEAAEAAAHGRKADAAMRLALSPSLQKVQPIDPPADPAVSAESANPPSAPATAAAQPSEPTVAGITLEEFESLALSNNPSIRAASAAVTAARGAAVQAGLQLNPTVGYQGQQIGSGGLAEQDGIQVNQEFLRHEKRTLNRQVAQREVQMAEQRYYAFRYRVQTDVRVAFYRTVRAQRQIDVTRDLVSISEQALKAAQALFDAKEVARTDVLQAQIEVDVAQTLLENAFNQHKSAWNQLAAVVADPALPVQPLAGDLFAPPTPIEFDAVLGQIRAGSPELCEAAINVQRARSFLKRQLVETKPNLGVQALYNVRDEGIGGRSDGGVGLTVPVPVWNRNQGAIQQARYQVSVAEQSYAQLDLALQQRLAPVYERYSNAKNLMSRYGDRILPAAAETLDLTRRTFAAGEIGFTNLLIAQRSYSQQKLLYLDAAESLRVAEAEINGLLLSGSLTTQAQ